MEHDRSRRRLWPYFSLLPASSLVSSPGWVWWSPANSSSLDWYGPPPFPGSPRSCARRRWAPHLHGELELVPDHPTWSNAPFYWLSDRPERKPPRLEQARSQQNRHPLGGSPASGLPHRSFQYTRSRPGHPQHLTTEMSKASHYYGLVLSFCFRLQMRKNFRFHSFRHLWRNHD